MAKKRVLKSERGVTLTESVQFGGEPRVMTGVEYIVHSKRKPEGRVFDNKQAARKYFSVQVAFAPKE
ncbi:MAG: hypothetical protein J0I26_04990 [Alphaproteobacteria bacterium]|jgi:hypothetical protein|nr:hypothetical protein [Alphaproteobacteria bacterium]MBN9578403.1 hypothetical protein [Alphaproteobacteria bacterium]